MTVLVDKHSGSLSSKRVVTAGSALLLGVGFVANLFWDFNVEQFMFDAIMYITIAGLGFTGAEKFAPKR